MVLARSSHAARAAGVLFQTFLVISLTGCTNYADFSLPVLPKGADLVPISHLSGAPVLPRDQASDVLNPSVVLNRGAYWNYYSEFDGKTWHTSLATSPDGADWTKQGRVLSPDPKIWESNYIAANGTAFVEGDSWWYWYQAGDRTMPRIGLARSSDGRVWQKMPRPVLEPGPRGSWDEKGVADPYVLKLNGEFYVYYLGQNRAHQQQIGFARSADGVHWVKARANPVLTIPWPGSGASDENGLGEPAVWQSDGWYWMIYTGRNAREQRTLITARSSDGVHWEKFPPAAGTDAWDREVICDPTVLIDGGHIHLWFGGGDKARPDEHLNGQIGQGVVSIVPRSGAATQ